MGAGTAEDEARTRALLVLATVFLKRAEDPEQKRVAMKRIDQLLDRYLTVCKT